MKQVWQFDQETGYVLAPIMVADEMEINANFQTLVKPPENVSVKFDKNVGKWVEFTPTTTPTTDQQAQTVLALQLAQVQQEQATFNAQIMLRLADLKPTTN